MKKILLGIVLLVVIFTGLCTPAFSKMSEADKNIALSSIKADVDYLTMNMVGFPIKGDESKRKDLEKRFSHIVDTLKPAVAEYPDDYDLNIKLGYTYLSGSFLDIPGSWDKAVYHMEKASMIKKDSTEVYGALGGLYMDKKYWSRGIQNYFRAIRTETNESAKVWDYINLSDAFMTIGDYWSAYYYAGDALKIDPKDEKAQKLREEAEPKIMSDVMIKIDADGDMIKYVNDMFKYEIDFPMDWDICNDSYDGVPTENNQTSANLDLCPPQTMESGAKLPDNLYSLHVIAARGTLDKMVSAFHNNKDFLRTDTKESNEQYMNGAKEYTFSTFDDGKMRKVYEIYYGEPDGLKYLIYHAAVADKYDEGQKIFADYIKMIKITK